MNARTTFNMVLIVILTAIGPAWLSAAAEMPPATAVTVILSHLPLKTSRAYFRLRAAAGNPSGEILPMTKSEVWTVPVDRLGDLRKSALPLGVGVTVVGKEFGSGTRADA